MLHLSLEKEIFISLYILCEVVIMKVFASCGAQLVEDQYLVTQRHMIGLKIFVGCYALTTEQQKGRDIETCTNQQPPQRGGAAPDPV